MQELVEGRFVVEARVYQRQLRLIMLDIVACNLAAELFEGMVRSIVWRHAQLIFSVSPSAGAAARQRIEALLEIVIIVVRIAAFIFVLLLSFLLLSLQPLLTLALELFVALLDDLAFLGPLLSVALNLLQLTYGRLLERCILRIEHLLEEHDFLVET